MKPELEEYLWANVPTVGEMKSHMLVRDVIQGMVNQGMIKSPKQAHATLEKWLRKGVYNYGSCLDLGWKQPESER